MAKKQSNQPKIQKVHAKALGLIDNLSKELDSAKTTYVKALRVFPEMEEFIRAIPVEVWDLVDNHYAYGNKLTLYIPWNWEIYGKMEKLFKAAGLVMTYEYDPAKAGRKDGYHQFTWRKQGDDWQDPYLEVNLDAGKEGSTCVLVPLETVTETVTRVTAYERICPEGHKELFDENGNYIGEPLLAKDKTKEAQDGEKQ